jgi:RNA polymerase sigma-70 factor (ECF subfamily)
VRTPQAGDRSEASVVRVAVDEIRRGDREAFGRLVELYQARVYALALMIVRDRPAAEEVAQDAFVRALLHLDRYDESRPFYPWLATIAVRLAHTSLRNRGRTAGREGSPLEPEHAPSSIADPLADLIADEQERRVWRAVAALPSGERTAVYLYYRHDMAVRDIAHALGVTSGTIKTLLFRARQHLRRALDPAGAGRSGGRIHE